jgi:multicomponent Na+:H+ antiporter subunit G
MRDVVATALLLLGAALMLIAAIGIVRLPDLFTRMHAAAKPGTLGVGLMMLGVAVHFGEAGVTTWALLVIVFFLLTIPVATHMIAHAAYQVGVPLWEGTIIDELGRSMAGAAGRDVAGRDAGPADGPGGDRTPPPA